VTLQNVLVLTDLHSFQNVLVLADFENVLVLTSEGQDTGARQRLKMPVKI
jgi:hypothetical protein